MKRFTTYLFTLGLISIFHWECLANENADCLTVKVDGYGDIALRGSLLEGTLDTSHLPYHEVTRIFINPPLKGNLNGGIYIDRLTLSWDNSYNPKPKCDLVLQGTMAGNYYNCFVDWKDKPLAVGVLIHTQSSYFDLDGLVMKMKGYVEEKVLSCPQPKK